MYLKFTNSIDDKDSECGLLTNSECTLNGNNAHTLKVYWLVLFSFISELIFRDQWQKGRLHTPLTGFTREFSSREIILVYLRDVQYFYFQKPKQPQGN